MNIGSKNGSWLRQHNSITESHVLQTFAFLLLLLRQVEGQALHNVYKVALYGANEVGYPGDPTASGSADMDFDLGAGVLYFKIRSDRHDVVPGYNPLLCVKMRCDCLRKIYCDDSHIS